MNVKLQRAKALSLIETDAKVAASFSSRIQDVLPRTKDSYYKLDRATLERTIQHVLKSMLKWGLLRSGPEKGSLIGHDRRIVVADGVGRLLAHSVLLSLGQGLAVPKLIGHPSLFPFEVNLHASSLRESSRFRVHREGDQSDFVELA